MSLPVEVIWEKASVREFIFSRSPMAISPNILMFGMTRSAAMPKESIILAFSCKSAAM